ncbi:hypothetical protein ACFSOV_12510 [Pedobacter petrophilus]|uniref:hypothetical protein n=1 Tax=Pedobacter petrophilus TaxID=1908241 RepID=UPI001ADF17C8|nr:hypothetical protein [Pedobacter petrophilus]
MTTALILSISILAIAGVIFRPFNISEHFWAGAGAVILLFTGLLKLSEGFAGVTRGIDVYLFLIGMMLLAETARIE